MATTIDREKECPFLLRIFTRVGGHHANNEYTVDAVPEDELQLYTWMNATLEELAQLIQEVVPDAQHPDARIAFRLIYLDSQRAAYRSREIGRVVSAKPSNDQTKTLEECRFFIGDYLDVAIYIGPPRNAPRRGGDWGSARDGGGGPMRHRLSDRGGRFGRDRGDRGSFRRDDRPAGRRDRF